MRFTSDSLLPPDILQQLPAHLSHAKHPLLAVLGPTASGKTDFSLDLAERIAATANEHGWNGAEIINADSRQLYRRLDIGTAKIRPEDRRGIPHHLIDVLEPSQEVTIAWYQKRATEIIEEILQRKHVPILVGGSMLYISSIIDGLQPLDVVDPELRKKLEKEYDVDGGVRLYAKLKEIDPEAASAFHPNNKVYLIRAMEIYEATGTAPSAQKRKTIVPYDLFLFAIRWSRALLVCRIDARTRSLLQSPNTLINEYMSARGGWVEEVAMLLRSGLGPEAPAMKSHGYREIMEQLLKLRSADGTWTVEAMDVIKQDATLCERIAANTRKFAKRQMTWWGNDPRIHWVDGPSL